MRNTVRHANKWQSAILQGHGLGPRAGLRVGLIVNPVAGMGGAAGLKGTDGADRLAEAVLRGAVPIAAQRTRRMLAALRRSGVTTPLLAAPGAMGFDVLAAEGMAAERIGRIGTKTTGADTRRIAGEMAAAGAGLILFAGGDGTARDVASGAPGMALLGVPSGVKMHSAVFGLSPEAAGAVAARFLADPGALAWQDADIMDVDEAGLQQGRVSARLFGVARAPLDRGAMQRGKAPSRPADETALEALADEIADGLDETRLHVLGCGATMRKLKRRLGGEGTLLGVDVALGRRLIATDVDHARLERLLGSAPAKLIVGVTGGQGFLFGRGNQQISPAVLGRLTWDDITVMCGARKLAELDPAVLRVDTGDPDLDRRLCGYARVRTGPGQSMIMKVSA